MSTGTWVPRRMPLRRLAAVLGALVGVGLIIVGGTLLPVQTAQPSTPRAAASSGRRPPTRARPATSVM